MTVHGDDITTVRHVTNRCRKLKNGCTSIMIITSVRSAQQRWMWMHEKWRRWLWKTN